MNMPGFTAEASLYRTNKNYLTVATNASSTRGSQVVPQFFFCMVGLPLKCCGARMIIRTLARANMSIFQNYFIGIPFLVTKLSPYYDR